MARGCNREGIFRNDTDGNDFLTRSGWAVTGDSAAACALDSDGPTKHLIKRGANMPISEVGTRFPPTSSPPPRWRFPPVRNAHHPALVAATCGSHRAGPATVIRSRCPRGRYSPPSGQGLCNVGGLPVPLCARPTAAQQYTSRRPPPP